MRNKFLKQFALGLAVLCVRDTVIEDYHARGSLSQDDMKAFNKEVANKIYTVFEVMKKGTEAEKEALDHLMGMNYPTDWDEPRADLDLRKAVRLLVEGQRKGERP